MTPDPTTITDTLDGQLRASLAPAGPTAGPSGRPAADLGALVAEVALKHAHELDSLEASAGAVENLGLGFHLGAAMERIALAASQGSEGAMRLREAAWLIERYVTLLEARPLGADIHASTNRLVQTGGTLAADAHEIVAELVSPAEPAAESETVPVEADATAPMPAPIVYELPSIGRELFLTAARATITVVAITAFVLLLTLIAQYR